MNIAQDVNVCTKMCSESSEAKALVFIRKLHLSLLTDISYPDLIQQLKLLEVISVRGKLRD